MFKHNLHVKKRKRGQSTVEYIILVAAVIAALIVFLAPQGPFKRAYNKTLYQSTETMNQMGFRLANSIPTK